MSKAKNTVNNNNIKKNYNSYSNSFFNNDKNEFNEEQFKEYLKALINIEEEIEKGKKELALSNDFNYEQAFYIFDRDCKCYVTYENLKEGLKYLGLETNDEEIMLLFNNVSLYYEWI